MEWKSMERIEYAEALGIAVNIRETAAIASDYQNPLFGNFNGGVTTVVKSGRHELQPQAASC